METANVSSPVPIVKLRDGRELPQIGFGTVNLDDLAAEKAIPRAINSGYRLIDTASRYGNEAGVGRAIQSVDVSRESLWLTSKVRGRDQGYNETLRAFTRSAADLRVDYIDLYLIHWPLPMLDKYLETWKAMITLQADDLVQSIGVSNFLPEHIERLISETGVVPAVNQVQVDIERTRPGIRRYGESVGIVTESWSPLAQAKRGTCFTAPQVDAIARKHSKTRSQIILRWHVQNGLVPIPKSGNPSRMAENIDIFDFRLDDEDQTLLEQLDRGDAGTDDPMTYYED
jgi:2,5-diketo-D-gluconate reductase A